MRFAYIIEPPFNHIDHDGTVTGHDVEVARHVAMALGESFEPVETTFADLLPGLARGDWQMATGMFATPERQKTAQFTNPIWALGDGLLVASGNPKALHSYADCARTNARMALLFGQEQRRVAQACGVADHQIIEFDDYEEAACAVRDGKADAYASVFEAHTGFLGQHEDWPCMAVPVPVTEKPLSFGCLSVARDADALSHAINGHLSAYIGGRQHIEMARRFGFDADQITRLR